MKVLTAIGITLLVLFASLWIMTKLGAGNGIGLTHMDPQPPYQVTWIMPQEERAEEEDLVNYQTCIQELDEVSVDEEEEKNA